MILAIIQIILSIALIALVLLQQPGEGGLGSAFGSGSGENIARAKRGTQKFLFRLTVGAAILFLASSFLRLII